jgi:hypothetical protein
VADDIDEVVNQRRYGWTSRIAFGFLVHTLAACYSFFAPSLPRSTRNASNKKARHE